MIKTRLFSVDGMRVVVTAGLLEPDQTADTGGDLFFCFGLNGGPQKAWFFDAKSWTSPSYYVEKMFPHETPPGLVTVLGWLALMAVKNQIAEVPTSEQYLHGHLEEYYEGLKNRKGLGPYLTRVLEEMVNDPAI